MLDLSNFRTVQQKKEINAINAMISISPDWFWSLTESLLNDGYHPTENIIVLKNGNKLIVKEGNRRIGILKIISGSINYKLFEFPSNLKVKIAEKLSKAKQSDQYVPCAIYKASEAAIVDKIVSLTHGKGEKAGRDIWNAVARARHSRDKNQNSEPALDLLEKYLKHGKNITTQQRERWGGDFPLTVLEEAIKKISLRFALKSDRELVRQYPNNRDKKSVLDALLIDIGTKTLGFKEIRNNIDDFGEKYGIPRASKKTSSSVSNTSLNLSVPQAGVPPQSGINVNVSGKPNALSTNNPIAVIQALKKFTPKGNYREKLVTLLEEARLLTLRNHPHSFVFILRSMFEISAKAYCKEHVKNGGPLFTKSDGTDKILADVLRDIEKHLTKNQTDKNMVKVLHGAMAEIGRATSFLSVTSMNQLIHNPNFSINETHISSIFFNVFPLLEEMNK